MHNVLLAVTSESDPAGSQILTAILGGSIAVLLTAVARAIGIPGDVRSHDAAIADRDEALATWVADRDYALRKQCTLIRAPSNVFRASQRNLVVEVGEPILTIDHEVANARAAALHEYRDEVRRANLDVAQILAAEGWPHRLWRRRVEPTLATPDKAKPVLKEWRRPSGASGKAQVWPDDATKRTLDDAIRGIPVSGP